MSAGLILIIFSALAFAFGGRTDALPVGVTPADAQSAMLAASLFRYGALLVCAVTAFLWRRRLRDELDAVRKRPNGELERWLLSAFCVVFFFSFVVVFANRALVAAASNAEASSALLPLAELAALWLGVIAVLWGLGLFAVRFVTAGAAAHGLPFWWGLFAVTVFLQLWHLAAPISLVTLLVVAGGGIAGLVVNRRAVVQSVRENAWLLAAVSSLGLWIANRALAAPRLPDFGLYHVPMMRWTQAYAIVPGLGNLHGRLAFNNSSLLYAALVDKAPGNGSGWLAFGGPMLLVFRGRLISRRRAGFDDALVSASGGPSPRFAFSGLPRVE
ncbi:MAG: hypothetical protein M5R36_04970 [Deltaproteobacteria bacterium]|nr:hypothetical protein [Deltaproteobacteria bacterium]